MENRTFHATVVYGGKNARTQKGNELARKLVCSNPSYAPCGECRDCRKAMSGIHPDIISVEQYRSADSKSKMISVGMIRDLRADVYIRPNEAERKVYLIPDAQEMNLNAANALLKVLEEGPAYAAFIFMCDTPGSLLETIRSRCTQLNAGEDEQPEYSENALEFAKILATGREMDISSFLVKIELSKLNRNELNQFCTEVSALCSDAVIGSVTGSFAVEESKILARDQMTPYLLNCANAMKKAAEMNASNVNIGNILGWICTQLFN